ncbi:hypothetical protein [Glycomyces salinus]|uniref:hypothetical protein n=1 Tax=Glycomyces salinus TaxID=980294 RepID=UPI0018EBF32E|nr:hypothetical protein [Glycomyces salinus]
MVGPNRYITIEQLKYWAGDPVVRWRTVGDAGERSHRYLKVAPMHFYILTVDGGYEADIAAPFPHEDDALAAADRIMSEPDPRGVVREWEVDHGQPRPSNHSGFSYGRPRQ